MLAHVIEDVTFIKTPSGYCSEGSAAIVLDYLGVEIDPYEIHDMGFDVIEEMEPLFSKWNGKYVKNKDELYIEEQIKKGKPIAIRIRPEGQEQLHTVVVVGIDKEKGIWVIHDSNIGPYLKVDRNKMLREWESAGRGVMTYELPEE